MRALEGKLALVTGASRGIGAATALALAEAGAHVVITARTAGGLEELEERIHAAGGSATIAPLDLTETDAIARLAAARGVALGIAQGALNDIVALAVGGTYSVSALAKRYPMSFAAVQKHVAVLEGAGLVTKERRGREQLVRTDVDTVHRARVLLDGIEELWRARIDRIDDLLATEQRTTGGKR